MKKTNQILFAIAFVTLFSSSASCAKPIQISSSNYFCTSKKVVAPVTITVNDAKGSPVSGAKVYVEGINQEALVTDESGTATFYVNLTDPAKFIAVVAEDGTTVNQVVYSGESNIVTIPE